MSRQTDRRRPRGNSGREKSDRLLVEDYPLVFSRALAVALGLNAAIFLQQLHYWLLNPNVGKLDKGRRWVYNSVREWRETNFPFWSETKIKGIISKLEDQEILLSSSELNRHKYDRTKHYSIDYQHLDKVFRERLLQSGWGAQEIPSIWSKDQDTLDSPLGQNDPMDLVNLTQPIPETTTENTSHTTERALSDSEDHSDILKAYRETFPAAMLEDDQKTEILRQVSEPRKWRAVLEFWKSKRYNPKNIAGLLDRYDNWQTPADPGGRWTPGSKPREFWETDPNGAPIIVNGKGELIRKV